MSFYSAQRLTPSGLRLLAREIVPTADSDAAGGPAWLMPVLTLVVAGRSGHGRHAPRTRVPARRWSGRCTPAGCLARGGSVRGRLDGGLRRSSFTEWSGVQCAAAAQGLLRHHARRQRRDAAAAYRRSGRCCRHRLGAARSGVRPRELTERLLAFLVLLYARLHGGAPACGRGRRAGASCHVVHGRALAIVGVLLTVALAGGVLCVLALPSLPARVVVSCRRPPSSFRIGGATRRA